VLFACVFYPPVCPEAVRARAVVVARIGTIRRDALSRSRTLRVVDPALSFVAGGVHYTQFRRAREVRYTQLRAALDYYYYNTTLLTLLLKKKI
jgi:hypothetical protein